MGITCIQIKYMLKLDQNDVTPLALIGAIVPLVGFIHACLPTMRPALEKIFGPRWRCGSSSNSNGSRRWYKHYSRDPRHLSGTYDDIGCSLPQWCGPSVFGDRCSVQHFPAIDHCFPRIFEGGHPFGAVCCISRGLLGASGVRC